MGEFESVQLVFAWTKAVQAPLILGHSGFLPSLQVATKTASDDLIPFQARYAISYTLTLAPSPLILADSDMQT